jgi:sugar lactone lactonase YvrE
MFDQPSAARRVTGPRRRLLIAAVVSAMTTVSVGAGLVAASADPGDPPGTIRTAAGMTRNYQGYGFSGDGGKATDAQLHHPRGLAIAPNGDVFIADALNHRIRKIDGDGIITTVAGEPTQHNASGRALGAFSGDGGPATEAELNQPHGVAVDSQGNLYIADSVNNRIRRVDATTGVIETIAGSDNRKGQSDGPTDTAVLKFPKSMFMTADDVLYVCNTGGNQIIKMDLKAEPLTIVRVAGNSQSRNYGGDGGFATDAQLNHPQGVWVTPDGTVYISDSDNHLVRKVTPDGKISTIAGDTGAASANADNHNQTPGPADSSGDGGPASAARLNGPRGIAVDPAGNIYVAEEGGARIRRIDPSGTITTIAGTGTPSKADGRNPRVAGDPGPAPALEAEFDTIHDLNLDADQNLWIADSRNNRVRVIFDPDQAPAGTPPPAADPGTP